MSKHEDIINYILSLESGTKISVRTIANNLKVSEGTAYRAIKESDSLGIVTTIPRVGTLRIEKIDKKNIEALTYAEIVKIIGGNILGGKEGMHKSLSKFLIGAMTVDAMKKYISPGGLLIVGNREDAQKLALENESGVLISGGFNCSDNIITIANEKRLPVISSAYDTFTIATIINKAISESLIKKDIILIEDIMVTKAYYLSSEDIVRDWKNIVRKTKHSKYPVVDKNKKVIGIISLKQMTMAVNDNESILKFMSKEPITLVPKTTVSYASHVIEWEDVEMCPVVDNNKRLLGIITRTDVMKALQQIQRQPQLNKSLEDMIMKNFTYKEENNKLHFTGKIIPEMIDPFGTASWSSLDMLLSTIGIISLRKNSNINISVDSIMTNFMKPVQMDRIINIYTEVIDIGKNFCKVQIDLYDNQGNIVAKMMLSAKLLIK